MIDFTPALKAEATKIASEYKLGPIYTPPIVASAGGFKGVLTLPGAVGGTNWQGGAVDPETGILYVHSSINLNVFALVHDPQRNSMEGSVSQRGGRRCGSPAAGRMSTMQWSRP